MKSILLAAVLAAPIQCTAAVIYILEPGAPVDASKIVFNPEDWRKAGVSLELVPWRGSNVVLLTTVDSKVEPAMASHFVHCLDVGWRTYADLTGRLPRPFKQLDGKATVTAVPKGGLTCGAGCGYVGSTGVELAMFYSHNIPNWKKNEMSFPHYAFYELGRNFYTFGDRHSCFTTGFAVFMRYVCMDAAGGFDIELANRKHIERMEEVYAESNEPFLRTFTNLDGLGEKEPRLKDANGHALNPCDQPVTYAAAMLKLRKDHGGDAWVKKFFAALAKCPEVKPKDRDAAQRQCEAWLACASVAAGRDLTPVFCDRWRMELPPTKREAFQKAPWSDPAFDFTGLLK